MQINVKAVRIKMIERGISSQSELARLVGVHKQTLTNWFRGKNEPTLDNVSQMANILGCKIEDITYLRDPKAIALSPLPVGMFETANAAVMAA